MSIILTAALSGCAARPGPATYRLFHQDEQSILVPPGVKDASISERTFDLRTAADPRACTTGAEGGIELLPRHKKLRIKVRGGELEEQPAGWLTLWAASLEERGCVTAGDGFGVATRVAQSVPLRLRTEQHLLNHNPRTSGFTDLRPGHRLRVVSPVFRENAPPTATGIGEVIKTEATPGGLLVVAKTSSDLIGYETAWYAVEPRRRGSGGRIVPQFADFNQEGEVTRQPAPRTNYLDFDPSMAYFRMLFMARHTGSSDHDIFVVAAPTQALLEERTRALQADATSCAPAASAEAAAASQRKTDSPETNAPSAKESVTIQVAETPLPAESATTTGPGITSQTGCIIEPRQVAVVAFMAVTVQGKEVLAHPGSTVAGALREAGADMEQALESLEVLKPHGDRLAQVEVKGNKRDILSLPLGGGETIRW